MRTVPSRTESGDGVLRESEVMSSWSVFAKEQTTHVLKTFVENSGAPGGVAVVGADDDEVTFSHGHLGAECGDREPSASVVYDMASLTKVMATWPLVGLAIAEKQLRLESPMRRYFSGIPSSQGEITVEQLLTHTSGLTARTRLDRYLDSTDPLEHLILRENLETLPGQGYQYTGRGFILLGLLLERIYAAPLDQLARERVWTPWRMSETCYGPVRRNQEVAPTEKRLTGSHRTWGAVHDLNAALMGGVSGHAGVFSTAANVARFSRELISEFRNRSPLGRFLARSLRVHVVDEGVRQGFAWQITPSQSGTIAHHHGFTGCCVFLLPGRGRYIVFLSNVVYGSRDRKVFFALRKHLAQIIGSVATHPYASEQK